MSDDDITLSTGVTIPAFDVEFEFSHAGGPGGQNVNKVSTRVTLRFDLDGCDALSSAQKERIRSALGNRVTQDGVLLVTCGEHRSQHANRDGAVARFRRLLDEALRPRKRRRKTRPTRASRERRLRKKRRHSEKKRRRRPPSME